jgi:hypothetical protein
MRRACTSGAWTPEPPARHDRDVLSDGHPRDDKEHLTAVTTSTPELGVGALPDVPGRGPGAFSDRPRRPRGAARTRPAPPTGARARAYFASDRPRTVQTLLGLLWLLDGGLQFQSFMYSHGFIDMLTGMAPGQPGWLHDSLLWSARIAGRDLTVWNTLFALTQVAIGVGLLWRRTVKPALILSLGWSLVVWWFGEAFGMLFMNMAAPLTGAPGAVALYGLVALVVWPGRPGGLVGVRGARATWAVTWLLMAWLWLQAASSSANAVSNFIDAAPSGMSWLSTVQDWVAGWTQGNGLIVALVLSAASAAIAVGVARDRGAHVLLGMAIALNLAFWVVGQGLGGMFEGGATDPNAAPVFVLLALALWPITGTRREMVAAVVSPVRAPDGAPSLSPAPVAAPAPAPPVKVSAPAVLTAPPGSLGDVPARSLGVRLALVAGAAGALLGRSLMRRAHTPGSRRTRRDDR